MDGTIADYTGAMRRGLSLIASPNDPPLPEELHSGSDWLHARMDLVKRQPGFWSGLQPISKGMETLSILEAFGYKLMVLTKGPTRTTSAWTEKRDWCHKHLPGVPVTITEDKGLVYGKILFDDFPPYIERWLEWRPRGKVLMIDHPWNSSFKHERVLRISENTPYSEIKDFLKD